MKNSKGFTLIEMVIVFVVCAIFFVVAAAIFESCAPADEHAAEMSEKVANQARELGFQEVTASCDGNDTDGDSKVSCTVTYIEGGVRQQARWLCPSRMSFSKTCHSAW